MIIICVKREHCQTQELAAAAAPRQRAATPPAAVDLATVHAAARGLLRSMDEAEPAPAASTAQLSTPAAASSAAEAPSAAQDGTIMDRQAAQPPVPSGDVIVRDVPETQPPADASSEAAAHLTCCQSGRRFHLGCLSPQDQPLVRTPAPVPPARPTRNNAHACSAADDQAGAEFKSRRLK